MAHSYEICMSRERMKALVSEDCIEPRPFLNSVLHSADMDSAVDRQFRRNNREGVVVLSGRNWPYRELRT